MTDDDDGMGLWVCREEDSWWLFPLLLIIVKCIQALMVDLHIANLEIQDRTLFSEDPTKFWQSSWASFCVCLVEQRVWSKPEFNIGTCDLSELACYYILKPFTAAHRVLRIPCKHLWLGIDLPAVLEGAEIKDQGDEHCSFLEQFQGKLEGHEFF